MNKYKINKVLAVNSNLNLKECEKILCNEGYCFGILDENKEITSFVLKEDLTKALKFNIESYPINLIATLADIVDIDIENINEKELTKYIKPGLNKGVFVGKDRKEVKYVIVRENLYSNITEKYLIDEYKAIIPPKIRKALKYCYIAADKISLPIYLIGGIVRDVIIRTKNHCELSLDSHFFDIDITVETNAIEFSRHLLKEYPEVYKIKEIHEEFKTSKVSFLIDGEDIDLDIASTRKESYLNSASLPTVSDIGCSIFDDLVRRDFTINSMALSLNQNNFCNLTDPLNGYEDIKEQKIRILHPISFIDDPTRIVRAIKFGTRFNYSLEKATRRLMETCLDSGLFDNLGTERVKAEIKQTFNLNKPEGFNTFIAEKAYRLIDKDIAVPENIENLSKKCKCLIQKYSASLTSKDFIWLIYFGLMIISLTKEKIAEITNKIYISGKETEILLEAKSIFDRLSLLKKAKTRFEIYELLEGYFTESILIVQSIIDNPEIEEKLSLFQDELKNIKIYTTGKTLIEAGLSTGPVFGEILRKILKAKINGEISTLEDETEYIKNFFLNKSKNL